MVAAHLKVQRNSGINNSARRIKKRVFFVYLNISKPLKPSAVSSCGWRTCWSPCHSPNVATSAAPAEVEASRGFPRCRGPKCDPTASLGRTRLAAPEDGVEPPGANKNWTNRPKFVVLSHKHCQRHWLSLESVVNQQLHAKRIQKDPKGSKRVVSNNSFRQTECDGMYSNSSSSLNKALDFASKSSSTCELNGISRENTQYIILVPTKDQQKLFPGCYTWYLPLSMFQVATLCTKTSDHQLRRATKSSVLLVVSHRVASAA